MNKPRLLIVEDEAIVAADIAIRLGQLGYEVVGSTGSGEEALVMAGQLGADLVLMDIHLQGAMDGITAADEMRARFGLPVVFLTAYSESATLQRAKEVTPFGYILKPFEDRELQIVLGLALYKHQAENDLKRKYAEVERFNKLTVDRELRMIELKQEINALLQAAGRPEKYRIAHDE
jgi:CheY-like chemotaxis protein